MAKFSKNQIIKLHFVDMNDDGFGVARSDEGVVFVPFAIEGEEADCRIVSVKKDFCFGKIEEIFKNSPNRRSPKCPYFFKCGGCDIQHINRESQLLFKTRKVENCFRKYARIEVKACPTIGGVEWRYRNKVALPIDADGNIGLYRRNSHSVVPINDCVISKPWIKDLVAIFREYMSRTGVSGYDEKLGKGVIRHIVAREIGGCILVSVVINAEELPSNNILIRLLQSRFLNFGLNININKTLGNVILGERWKSVFGRSEIENVTEGITYKVSNASFFQVNDEIRDLIYADILKNINKKDVVIDAYSGAGMLTALISRKAKFAVGVEIVSEATNDANELKKHNGIENMLNINGDCSKILGEIMGNYAGESLKIVLDPPRKGCEESLLKAIVKTKPKNVLYLSCNPATLARDAKILISGGFIIKKIQPYDMFPQTSHVETLCIFERI